MKKVLVVLALCLMAFTAKAQLYVGGGINFQAAQGGTATINMAPEVGFCINDNMAVGGIIRFSTGNANTVAMNPYFRYSFVKFGHVKLFADADLRLTMVTPQGANTTTTTFGIGVCPGISYSPTRHINFAARMGQIGYYGGAFSFTVNTTALNIAAYYVF